MESSIVDVENTEFPSVKSPDITCLRAATKHAKWGQLNNSWFKFIYSRFLNTPHVNTNGWETQKDRMIKVSCHHMYGLQLHKNNGNAN